MVKGDFFAVALFTNSVGAVPADIDDAAVIVSELSLGYSPAETLQPFFVGTDI